MDPEDIRVKDFAEDLTIISRRHGMRLETGTVVPMENDRRDGRYVIEKDGLRWQGGSPVPAPAAWSPGDRTHPAAPQPAAAPQPEPGAKSEAQGFGAQSKEASGSKNQGSASSGSRTSTTEKAAGTR